jgi:hypothetical protein
MSVIPIKYVLYQRWMIIKKTAFFSFFLNVV